MSGCTECPHPAHPKRCRRQVWIPYTRPVPVLVVGHARAGFHYETRDEVVAWEQSSCGCKALTTADTSDATT